MDGGILPDLAVFVLHVFVLKLTGICVRMYLYLWVKIVALSRVLPRDKLGSDGNTQLGTNWSFVKLGTKSVRNW